MAATAVVIVVMARVAIVALAAAVIPAMPPEGASQGSESQQGRQTSNHWLSICQLDDNLALLEVASAGTGSSTSSSPAPHRGNSGPHPEATNMAESPTNPEPSPLPPGKVNRKNELKRPFTDVPEHDLEIKTTLQEIDSDVDFLKAVKRLRAMGSASKGLTKLFHATVLRDYSRSQAGRGIEDTSEDSIIEFEASMVYRGRKNKPITIAQKLTALRQFHVWHHRNENPGDWMRISIPKTTEYQPLDPFSLITPAEYKVLLDCCEDHRERAAVALLYEAGLRSGELRSLKMESVRESKDKAGFEIRLPPGDPRLKTGSRNILVVESAGYLKAWLARHPEPNSPMASVFMMEERDLLCLFRRIRRAAVHFGVNKRIYAHLLRHTAATTRARRGWNIPKMNRYFGWSDKAKTSMRYIHLADDDANDQVRRDNGLAVEAKDVGPIRHKCTCGYDNVVTARFCTDCGTSLNPQLLSEQAKLNAAVDAQFDRHIDELIRFRKALRMHPAAGDVAGGDHEPSPAPLVVAGPAPSADGAAVAA